MAAIINNAVQVVRGLYAEFLADPELVDAEALEDLEAQVNNLFQMSISGKYNKTLRRTVSDLKKEVSTYIDIKRAQIEYLALQHILNPVPHQIRPPVMWRHCPSGGIGG